MIFFAPVALDRHRSKQKGAKGSASEASGTSDVGPDRALCCRRCGTAVSSRRYVFAFRGDSVQVFPNPLGQMMKILMLSDAHGLAFVSEPTTEFTWFAGYAWTVVACGRCGAHLGWRYDAVDGAHPVRFYGLLVDAVRE